MTLTWIVGDVHGCSAELHGLLERLALQAEDNLIFVGDLVGKGPDSTGVLEQVRTRGGRSVLGNHDAAFLKWWRHREADQPIRYGTKRQAACRSLSDEAWHWLAALPDYIEISGVAAEPSEGGNGHATANPPASDRSAIVVHAGLAPGVPLAHQKHEHMLTMRSVRADDSISSRVDDGVPWASRWTGPQHVVFGHDALRGLQQYPLALGLDTGCVYGGELTAFCLEEERLVAIPAQKVWAPP